MKSNVASETVKIFSINAAGLVSGKLNTLRSAIVARAENIITIQKTHSWQKRLSKLNSLGSAIVAATANIITIQKKKKNIRKEI